MQRVWTARGVAIAGLAWAGAVAAAEPAASSPQPAASASSQAGSRGAVRERIEGLVTHTLSFPDAGGPPASSCKDDLARAPASVQWPRRSGGSASAGRGTPPPKDKQLRLSGTVVPVAGHAAMSPDTVPQVGLVGPDAAKVALAGVWEKAKRGDPVRLSFFGASHTGGDYWTGHLRRLLQDRWGDRGHGFVMPAPLYAGYRGQDVNLCATAGWTADWVGRRGSPDDGLLGFMGASVRADDPGAFGWIETTRENPHGRQVDTVDVFALAGPGSGSLAVSVDGLPPQTVALAADAPRLARIRVDVPDGAHRVQVSPAGDGEVRVFGASLERPGSGVIVDAMGIRGRTARTWLSWDEGLFTAGVRALAPDLVVLAYGTNEAADEDYGMEAYRQDLTDVLARLRSTVGPQVPCVLVGPSDRVTRGADDIYEPWPRTKPVVAVQREVATAAGCLFWDWQAATGGEGSMLAFHEVSPQLAAGDLIHFRKAGYEWSAERFLKALDTAAAAGERTVASAAEEGR